MMTIRTCEAKCFLFMMAIIEWRHGGKPLTPCTMAKRSGTESTGVQNVCYWIVQMGVEISSTPWTQLISKYLKLLYMWSMDTLTCLVNFTIVNVEMCRTNQNAHVKTSFVHTLHRVQMYSLKDLDYFKHLFSEEQYKSCALKSAKTWYPLTKELMVSFIFQVGVQFRN